MKNRLQFNYYIPSTWPYSRENAMAFIERTFSRNPDSQISLISEPIVVFYGEEQRRSNMILAIGRGGKGQGEGEQWNNMSYFTVDSALLDERLDAADEEFVKLNAFVEEVKQEFEEIKEKTDKFEKQIFLIQEDIKKLEEKDVELNGLIKENEETITVLRTDFEKEKTSTANRFVTAKNDRIRIEGLLETETERALKAEEVLGENIVAEQTRAEAEEKRIEGKFEDAVNVLDAKLGENVNRLDGRIDVVNNNLLTLNDTMTQTHNEMYAHIEESVNNEANQRSQRDAELDAKIDTEISRAQSSEKSLKDLLEVETIRAKETELAIQNKHVFELDTEIAKRASEDSILDGKIKEETRRAEGVEKELFTTLTDEIGNVNDRMDKEIITLNSTIDTKERDIKDYVNEEDGKRDERIESLKRSVNSIVTALDTETKERKEEGSTLDGKITDLTNVVERNRVVSSNNSIRKKDNIQGTNTDLFVNIDNKTIKIDGETGILSVDSKELVQYRGENAINVDEIENSKVIKLNVNPNDKILDNNIYGLSSTLSLKMVAGEVKEGEPYVKNKIQLLGKDDIVISEINAAEFGVLKKVMMVELESGKAIEFTFSTGEVIYLPVNDLVNIYGVGDGLSFGTDSEGNTTNTIQIKIDGSGESFLTLSSNGLKTVGIKEIVNDTRIALEADYNGKIGEVNAVVSNNLTTLTNEITRSIEKDTELTTKIDSVDRSYQLADQMIRDALAEAVNAVKEELRDAIGKADESVKIELRDEYNNYDNVVRKEFAAADEILKIDIRKEYDDADDRVKENLINEFGQADAAIIDAYKTADADLDRRLVVVENNATKEAERLDGAINTFNDTIASKEASWRKEFELEVAARRDNDIKVEQNAKSYTDGIHGRLLGSIESINTQVGLNEQNIKKLNGSSKIEGSVKNMFDGMVLGNVINTVRPEDAENQSLLRRIYVGDSLYLYASNNAADMVYSRAVDGSTVSLAAQLNTVVQMVEDYRAELAENKELISKMDKRIHELENQKYGDEIIAEVSNGIIERILNSIIGTENEIEVTKNFDENNAIKNLQIGFADGAVFQAGI